MSNEEIFARLAVKNYLWDYADVMRMNTNTHGNVKCVATLESKSGKDEFGQARIGSKVWFFREWDKLNPEEDTPMAKRHREGLFEDMQRILKLNGQHFGVHVDKNPDISNPVVFYITETLTALAEKYGMTLEEALNTIHDSGLGSEKMDFINEAFDDPIDVRNPPSRLLDIVPDLPHLKNPTLPEKKRQFFRGDMSRLLMQLQALKF